MLALVLRVWGIAFGVPHDLTADEPHYIVQALKVGAGEGGPLLRIWHTIGKGGLDYLLFAEYGVVFAVLWLTGRVSEPRDFALLYLEDPTIFYLVGRVTVAVLGAATVLALYGIGHRLYDRRTGLAAALVAATAYYHVAESHLINVHVPMAFALWAAIWMFVRFEQHGRLGALAIAGALQGGAIALAYTAGIGLLLMLVMLATGPRRPAGWADGARVVGSLLGPVVLMVALMSPDLLLGAGLLLGNFSTLLGLGPAAQDAASDRALIDAVTILRAGDWGAFLGLFAQPGTAPVALAAVLAAGVGAARRERWTLAFTAAVATLLVIVSVSNRGVNEVYLFPVLPAMWLLAARGVTAVAAGRGWALWTALALLCAYPLFAVVRNNTMISQPDTREIAKAWVEANVPSGAKILMDGERFRYVQSIPLQPNAAAVARRLDGLGSSELALSDEMLSVYREAALRVKGPTYDLHSTVYGLEVEDVDHYVRESFDYVVISSYNEKRFDAAGERAQYPKSAAFYDQVRRDPRLERVFTIEPAVWLRSGPTITIYAVRPRS